MRTRLEYAIINTSPREGETDQAEPGIATERIMKKTTEYAIVVERNYYGPRVSKTRLMDEKDGTEWRGSRAQARAEIEALNEGLYYTSQDEVGRAGYTIVAA